MDELQLRIGGRPMTDKEMDTLDDRYPLTHSVMYMCQIGPSFQKPIDDDDATVNKEDGSTVDEFNATST